MRHAPLMQRDKENGEVILILEKSEFHMIVEAVEGYARANPRRKSLKTFLARLGEVEVW